MSHKLTDAELSKLCKSYEDEIDRLKLSLRMTEYLYSLVLSSMSDSNTESHG